MPNIIQNTGSDTVQGAGGRIAWVDIFKGLCIILMVIGHSDAPGVWVTFVYSFHMAAFIVAAGYTYSGRKYSVIEYIKKRFFSLIVPYAVINLMFIILISILQAAGLGGYIQATEDVAFLTRIRQFFSLHPATAELGGASWFLVVLFITECLCRILQEICWKIPFLRNRELLFMAGVGLWGYYLAVKQISLPFDLDLGLAACLLFAIGAASNRYKALERIPAVEAAACSIVILLFFGGAFFAGTMPVNWPTRSFPTLGVWLMISISGVYLLYRLAVFMEGFPTYAKVLTFVGKRTFAVLMWHFLSFRCLTALLIAVNIQPVYMLQSSPPAGRKPFLWIVYTCWAIGLCLLGSVFFSRWKVTDYIFNGKYSAKEKRNDEK